MSLKNLNAIKKNHKILFEKLKIKKVYQFYKEFEKNLNITQNFAVAVSGGPDSLALAFFSKIYSIQNHIKCNFFVVDHKFRKESSKEATQVKKILQRFSINCKILSRDRNNLSKKTQDSARKKRYNLLFAECKKKRIKYLLLGHHLDDLFENFFIRMLRGSGLRGLVSLDKINQDNNIVLVRPLLDLRKVDLIYISKTIFDYYVDDPSNKDEKYKRIVIRNLLREFEKNGLDKKKLNLTIRNLKESNEVIKFHVNQNLKNNSCYHVKKGQLFLVNQFFNQPNEIVFRSFSIAIKKIGQKYYLTRGKKIDKILKAIKKGTLKKATLGGCFIKKVNQTVILSKEK